MLTDAAPPVDPIPVDPITYERHEWHAESDGLSTRAQVTAGSGAYESSVPAMIGNWRPAVPADLAADVEEAAADLARLDHHAAATLGADSPVLGPMSSILLRTESTSSSQIENLTVGARQLAMAELDESTSENAKMVVANVRTMEAALALAEQLDERAILSIHRELLGGRPRWGEHAGRYRDGLVWVGTSGISPRGASFVGPQPSHIRAAMADLVSFIQRDDLAVLLQASIAHAQFETIHPFADGNGRTGRALVHALLHGKKLLRSTTAPVSAGLLTDTSAYVDALTSYRLGDARPIIEQFTRAARYAADTGARLVDDLAAQIADAQSRLGGLRPQAAAWRVVPHLVAHPVINARYLTSRLGMSDVTAQRALAQLESAGVLDERTGQKRNRVWVHAGVLAVLDEYATRIRRG